MKYLSRAWGIEIEAMQFQGDEDSVNAFDAWLNGRSEPSEEYGDCDFYAIELNTGREFDIYPGWYCIKGEWDYSFVAEAEFERVFARPRQ